MRIDDNNWIVDNKFISFEEDTPILRLKQKIEDDKHYLNYKNEKLRRDKVQLYKDWLKTIEAIHKYPYIKDCVTVKKLENITEKYNKYLLKCEKLNENTMILSKEQFLIKEEYPNLCVDFSSITWIFESLGFYNIYNKKTARYYSSNIIETIKKEFETDHY